jgi:hypothetical protein
MLQLTCMMGQPVPPQRGRLVKSCITFIALIWSRICVDYIMQLQVPFSSEFRATFVAFERLLVGVGFHVNSKFVGLTEASVAYRTHVRLDDVVMCKHMPSQVSQNLESCTTLLTHVRPGVVMRC